MARNQDSPALSKLHEYYLDDPDFLRGIVFGVLQQIIDSEMEEHLSAGRYERTEDRQGYRSILATDICHSENEAGYSGLFKQLKDRGLSGVQLVISDDHTGMKKAIGSHFTGASLSLVKITSALIFGDFTIS